MERLGKTCIVRFGANTVEARCTGVANYTARAASYLFEWIDSTGRPVSAWVEAEQIEV